MYQDRGWLAVWAAGLVLGAAAAAHPDRPDGPVGATNRDALEGSTWVGTDPSGATVRYNFRAGGTLVYVPQGREIAGRAEGRWRRDGAAIRFEVNRYSDFIGHIAGGKMTGHASNRGGLEWSWELTEESPRRSAP